ncbi:ABC transporter ATP-binding protein [Desertivirga xinjiangensis]|uniref:ABC transporter ATP-binding protein n=1 Tax=Desertivirga xinjiangensis TaxID=539206 RepID=UPI00210F0558|nr:ATP-binding cassette domain-containing protein [Pedobacter xinjiangensis]
MLSVKNIVKQYANHRALNNVSFDIQTGSIFGLLGPNGAGKTSLIRIINQITAPDEGIVLFDGEKLQPSHISSIGYLPEERGLYKKMEIGEQVIYLSRLKGLSQPEALNRAKYWFEKLDMQTWWKKKVEDLSKGMQQKVQFIASVIHEPRLIILDEPFSGFDPVNADVIKNEILELNKRGATIIFSTHRMESVEQLCDSIVLLHRSKKILEGKVKDIRNSFRDDTYKIQCRPNDEIPQENGIFEILKRSVHDDYTELTLKLEAGKTTNEALAFLLPKVEILSLTEVIPTIHEIFVQKVTGTD